MKTNRKKLWLAYILLLPICYGFYIQNTQNYELHKQIRLDVIEHPEKLPTSNTAIISSFGNRKLLADFYWMQTIQYIGWNVISGEYKRYLYSLMDLITDIDPHFTDPYITGQLLLPASNARYEDFNYDEVHKNIKEGEQLWLKGIERFCDQEKVNSIMNEENLREIIENESYRNPCKEYKIPYYLAYIYHFHLNDSYNSSQYYKVVSAQEDAPEGAKTLAAIMLGKSGEREKSTHMFLSLAQSLSSNDEACNIVSQELWRTYNYITLENKPITWELIQTLQTVLGEIHPDIGSGDTSKLSDDTECVSFLAKAVREINLLYLDRADAAYIKDHPLEESAHTPEKLLETGYITFNPKDYQQVEWENFGIVYRYNPESRRFDYEMWEARN